MKHQIYPDRFNDDGEFVPAVIVEVPETLYLQVVDEGDCEDWPAPSEPDERTFTTERLSASDVAYVPLARAERAEAEAAQLRADLDAAREAAHMPDDWPHGLPSWITQRLYAAYIGAAFSPDVMEQIRAGRLTFPEAPIYAERDELRAQLDAARAELGTLRKRINIVMNQAAIQCDDGNWNYSDYMRGLANGLLLAKSDLDNSPYLPLARPERWLEEVAGRQWRPNDDQALFEDKDIEGEIILTATFQQRNHCWNVDGISILPSGVVAWRPRTAAPDEEE